MYRNLNFVKLSVIILIAVIALSACAPKATSLANTSWTLVEVNGNPSLSNTTVSLNFNGNKLTGNDGCNLFGGSYESDGNKLSIGDDLMGTLMACMDDIMLQANDFNKALGQTATFKIDNNRLSLFAVDGSLLAVFDQVSQELAGTSWLATFVSSESENTAVTSSDIQAAQQTITFDQSGNINGNAGCNSYFGTFEVDGSSLSIKNLGWTEMFCGESLMAQETAYLAALEKADSYHINASSLQILAADGSTLISFTPQK